MKCCKSDTEIQYTDNSSFAWLSGVPANDTQWMSVHCVRARLKDTRVCACVRLSVCVCVCVCVSVSVCECVGVIDKPTTCTSSAYNNF